MQRDLAPPRCFRRLAAVCTLLGILGACDAPTVCHDGIFYVVSPADTTLVVGQFVEPSVRLSACGPPDGRAVAAAFTSPDTAVVRVEASTPRLRAVGPGEAHVTVSDSTGRSALGVLRVSVIAAP